MTNQKGNVLDNPGASWKLAKLAIVLIIGGLLATLSWHSCHFQVDYFDSFSVLKTAKGLADGQVIDFNWRKPPLMSILLAPFFATENMLGLDGMAHVAGRLLSLSCFAALLFVTYRMISLYVDRATALIGVFLLALNPLFIHNAPFSKDDFLGALLASLAIYCYARFHHNNKLSTALTCALVAGLAMTARYNLLPTLALYFLMSESIHWIRYRSAVMACLKRAAVFICLPLTVFVLIQSILYQHLHVAALSEIPLKLLGNLTRSYELMAMGEPPLKNYIFLLKTLSWPVLVLFVWGLVTAVVRKEKATLTYGLWFIVYFVFHSYFVDHKEARYLMPIYPVIYFFVAKGLLALAQEWKRFACARQLSDPASRGIMVLATLAITLLPLKNAWTESRRLMDPFYTVDFEKEVSRYAQELAGGHDVIWVGPHYPLVPKEYIFDKNDEFWYMFHFSAHVAYVYTGKDVVPVLAQPQVLAGTPYIFVPLILQFADDGDALIINREEKDFRGSNFSGKIHPLYVQKVSTLQFAPADNPREFRLDPSKSESASMLLRFEVVDGSSLLAGTGIPNGTYELYFQREGEPQAAHISFITVQENRFSIQVTDLRSWDNIIKIVLLTYVDGAAFPHPTYPAN